MIKRVARILAGMTMLALAAIPPLPTTAQAPQPKIEVVLQLAGPLSWSNDQPYSANVQAVALSPDERLAATGDINGIVRLWNVADGKLIRTLRHPFPVAKVTFSPDGRRLISASKAIRSWDTESGRLIHSFDDHSTEITAFALSPDGERLAVGTNESTSVEFEVLSGVRGRSYVKDLTEGPVQAIAYSQDRRLVLTVHSESLVRLWNADTSELIRPLEADKLQIAALAFSADAAYAIAVGPDNPVVLWDVASGKRIEAADQRFPAALAAFSGGKEKFPCCGQNPEWLIDSVQGKAFFPTLQSHAERVLAFAYSRSGSLLLEATEQGALRLFDVETGKPVRVFNAPHANTILAVAFSPDGRHVLAGENARRAQLWDLNGARFARKLEGSPERMFRVGFSSKGSKVIVGDGSRFDLLETESGRRVRSFETKEQGGLPVVLSPNGRYALFTGPKDKTASLWDLDSGQRLRSLQGDLGGAFIAAFSPDGSRFVTGGTNEQAKLWDTATGRIILTFEDTNEGGSTIAFTPDGSKVLMLGGADNAARFWDVQSGKRLEGPGLPLGETFTFSSDGRYVLVHNIEQTKLFESETGRPVVDIAGSIPFETPALFPPDGRSFVIGGYDLNVTRRDVRTGGIVHRMTGHAAMVTALALSPNGRRIVSASPDTTLKLWDLSTGELLATFLSAADGEWVILTPEGFFSASPKGGALLRVVSGLDVLSIDTFRELLQRPDIVAEKIAGDPRGVAREAAAKLDLAAAFAAARRSP